MARRSISVGEIRQADRSKSVKQLAPTSQVCGNGKQFIRRGHIDECHTQSAILGMHARVRRHTTTTSRRSLQQVAQVCWFRLHGDVVSVFFGLCISPPHNLSRARAAEHRSVTDSEPWWLPRTVGWKPFYAVAAAPSVAVVSCTFSRAPGHEKAAANRTK